MPEVSVRVPHGVRARKLLMVATIPETIESFLLPYAERMRARGWQVDGAAREISASRLCRTAFDDVVDVDWSRSPLDLRNFWRKPSILHDLVTHRNYGIVHVHTPVASFVTRLALRSRPGGVRIVYTAHGFHFHSGGAPLSNLLFATVEKLAARWTDELIVMNQEDDYSARKLQLARTGRQHLLPGVGIDTSRFARQVPQSVAALQVQQELNLPADARLVLMIAEFNPGKRHEDAFKALAHLNDPSVHLLLAGIGPLLADMQALAARLGLKRQIHFLGYRSDVPELLSAAEVLLLPSLREGLPRSIMEAMGMGVPVIATEVRGVTDLLSEGAGLLVPVRSPKLIAQALGRLLADPQLAEALTRAAAQRIRRYALPGLLDWHEQFYERIRLEGAAIPPLDKNR